MKEYKINEFLTLKLEEGETNLYVNGEYFHQCTYLMLNIPVEDISKYDEIESIDEANDILGWKENGQEGVVYQIDPETEFWGHCSNLQAWYEHNYDTRLLHSNLAFPLLKELVEAGDPLAKKVFREEIALRIESGYPTTIAFIIERRLLDYFNKEDRRQLVEQILLAFFENIENLECTFSELIESLKEAELIKDNLSALLEGIDKFTRNFLKFNAFSSLLNTVEDTEFVKEHLSQVETLFLTLLDDINTLSDHFRYYYFADLVEGGVKADLIKKYCFQIETLFLVLLKYLDKVPENSQYSCFVRLIEVGFTMGLIKDNFSVLLESIAKFTGSQRYYAYSSLLNVVEEAEFVNDHLPQVETLFLTLLDDFNKLSNHSQYHCLVKLIEGGLKWGLTKKYKFQVNTLFLALLKDLDNITNEFDKKTAFSRLIQASKDAGLIKEHYPALLECVDNTFDMYTSAAYANLLKASIDF